MCISTEAHFGKLSSGAFGIVDGFTDHSAAGMHCFWGLSGHKVTEWMLRMSAHMYWSILDPMSPKFAGRCQPHKRYTNQDLLPMYRSKGRSLQAQIKVNS